MKPTRFGWLICLALLLGLAALRTAPVQAQSGIVTNTPMADGSIVHIVREGENLASIAEAYGVSMADIRGMNGMAPTSNLIFPGQTLIIRLPLPATATPTLTPTVPRPTRTPTPLVPTRTPAPTRTVTPTLIPTPTPNPLVSAVEGFMDRSRHSLLIGMVALCAAGLVWVLATGFIRKR